MQAPRPFVQATILAALFAAAVSPAWCEPLLEAVRAGDSVAVRRLLEDAAFDANVAEADGTSVLHYAVERNDAELVDRLLDAGANADARNRYGVSPLYIAALNGNAGIVSILLDHGVDPNTALPEGETVLMTAARSGDVATIDVLARAGADPDAREDWKGQTALMWAAAENNAPAIRRLLEAGADRDATSADGEFTAIKFAVRAGAIDATRALLDAGADVDATMTNGTSLLVLAVTNAHYELAGVLLERGADPNADAQGWTALHQIAWSRRWNMGFNLPGPAQTGGLDSLELVRRLVAYGADIDARQKEEPRDGNRNKLDRIGATAFLLAAKSCDLPLMRVLLDEGADPSITTENDTTALMAAAGVGIWAPGENPGTHEEALAAVRLAYEVGGGDVNAVNSQGDTALHGAVYRGGAIPVIEFLVGRGAKLDAVNEFGWMPVTAADGLEYTPAVLKRYPEAAALLRRLMAEQGLPVPASTQPGRRTE
ncbi:MAG TPA: ankyrin repeat domain-containing protein [Gammaproteobacteria bacterium]|nr:ankyrin repeat domain-containing protein [Gammaproteobacteria bacterium]